VRPRTGLGLLVAGALLRAWWLLVFLSDPSTRFPHGNTGGFIRVARLILDGDLLAGDRPFFYGPLYSVFLAPCFALTGSEDLLLPRLLQSLLGLTLAILVWRITRRTFDEAAALAAGAFLLFFGPALFFEGLAVATTLSTVLLLLAVDLLTAAFTDEGAVRLQHRTLVLLAASGAAFGACAWGRGNVLLLLPPAALWILWRTPAPAIAVTAAARVSRRLAPTVAFTLGACALILPVTARNAHVSGDPVLLVSQGGLNYFAGNNPESPGFFSPPEGAGLGDDSDGAWEPNSRRVAESQLGRELKASEVSSYWFGRGLSWVGTHPADAAALHLRKLRLLLDPYELPIHRNAQVFLAEFPLGFVLPGWGLLVALSTAGLLLGGVGRDRRGLLLLLALVYAGTVLAFFVVDRYRFPLVPLLAPFAGLAIASFLSALRAGERPARRLIAAAALATGLIVALHLDAGPLRFSIVSNEVRGRYEALEYHRRGAAWERLGEPDLALSTYERALEAADILRTLLSVAPELRAARELLERAEAALPE